MRLTTETFARRRTPMPRPMSQPTSQPMSLPMLPELKKKEEERRRGAVAVPNLPGAAPVQVAVVGATPSSPAVWLARGLVRGILKNGLPAATLPLVSVVLAGLTLGFAYAGFVQEPEASPMSAAFIPHPKPVGEAAFPVKTPAAAPSSETMLRDSDAVLQGPRPAPAQAAAAEEPTPDAPAPEPSAEGGPVETPQESLKDAVASFKSRRPRGGERLSWGGQTMQSVQPQGGDFTALRPARAAAAAKAALAGRAAKSAALRRSVNLKLGTSRVQPGSANRAMGQLKLASALSAGSARSSVAEVSKQGGADAFEQGKTEGGAGLNLDAVPATGLGGSAPDVTESGAPALPAGENKTPYQKEVDDAKKKNTMTVVMLVLGAALIAAGIGLLVIANQVEAANPGLAETLKMIGYALLAGGALMLLLGLLMAQQAKKDGKEVGDKYGQKDQAAVIEDCADQSLGKQDCAPKAVQPPVNGVHEAVETEQNAGFTLGAEGAQGGKS